MKEAKTPVGMISLPDKKVRTYNLDDVTSTFIINEAIDKDIVEAGLDKYYHKVVKPLQYIVMDMQMHGVQLDTILMQELHDKASKEIDIMMQQWEHILGIPFNPSSPKQVSWLFNDLLNQKVQSTDKLSLLKAMRTEPLLKSVVNGVLEYRDFVKDRGTYLRQKPDPDGRIRTQFRVWGTLTWRLSSSDPNLQNIPRKPRRGINIKNIYCAPPGRLLYAIDYSQLEARIPAYASRCQKLMDIFTSGKDYYLALACIAFKREITNKEGPERFSAKTFKLAEGYGANAQTISDHILRDSYEYIEPNYIQSILNLWKADIPNICFQRN